MHLLFDESTITINSRVGDENGDDIKILRILEQQPEITAKELSIRISLSTRKISRIMKVLRETGTITRIGSDRKGYWQINKQ